MSAFRISYFPHNYLLANNMPLLRNNMPLSGNKDGLILHKQNRPFFVYFCHLPILAVNLAGFWRLSQMSTIQMVVLVM